MTKKYATDATIDYVILLRRWEIEQSAKKIKDLGGNTPTPAQVAAVKVLRDLWREIPDKIENEGLTHSQASKEISRIKQLRESNRLIERQKKSSENLKQLKSQPELLDGVYRNAETNKIYKVKRAVHGSGLKVAHELVISEEITVVDTSTEYEHDQAKVKTLVGRFQYVGLATKYVKAEWKMTLEDAKKFGALYGVCCNCGRTLTKEESIKAGIGPICAGKDIW